MLRLVSYHEAADEETSGLKFYNFSLTERPVLLEDWARQKFGGFQAPVSVAL